MNLSAAEIAALNQGVAMIGIFFRLQTTPVVRIWLGIGQIKPGINVLDSEGATYNGFGEMQGVPALKQLINGTAQRVEFFLSGVSGEILSIASGGDAEQVKGKKVSIGFAIFDRASLQLLGSIHWVQNYVADFLGIEQVVARTEEDETVRTVKLSCGSALTGRRRPGLAYYTDQDQQSRYPGDQFCERTPLYANQFNKTWPRLSG